MIAEKRHSIMVAECQVVIAYIQKRATRALHQRMNSMFRWS